MKKYISSISASGLLLWLALAGAVQAESYRGDLNAWGTSWMAQDTAFGSLWKVTVTAAATTATSTYKFDQDGDWNPQWGMRTGYTTNAVANSSIGRTRASLDLGGDPGNHTNSVSAGKRYTFVMEGAPDWWDRRYVIMETDADPINILNVFDDSANRWTNSVTVNIQLSASKSAQETIWVRFSKDSWASSQLAPLAAGSGTNYAATISGTPAGTNVSYYVFTSTMPSNILPNSFDLCTLRGKTLGLGTNYSYSTAFGNCWHFPGNAEPSGAYMRNPTNPAADEAVFIYTGNYVPDGNQTGGTLYYRKSDVAAWTATNLSYDSLSGDNKYWKADIPAATYSAGDTVQYYLAVTYSDRCPTYLGTTNAGVGLVKYGYATNAQLRPFSFTYTAPVADLGNAWHMPDNYEPAGAYMRNPRTPYTNDDVYVYNGNQFQGGGNPGDQTGGTLYYRLRPAGGWQSTNLAFDLETGNNKYWKSMIPKGTFRATNEVDYYLKITYNDHDDTYLGTTNSGTSCQTYSLAADAQAHPFMFAYGGDPGTEAGFMWHASNRVSLGSGNVQVWVKIGYAQGSGSNRWVDNAVIYYTTNGTDPAITGKGVPGNASTFVQAMTFDHMEEDSFEDGDAMWWVGTATNLPQSDGSEIRYKIGSWNGSGTERFAEYNSVGGTPSAIFNFSLFVAGAANLMVNGKNADYTATKLFIDEIAGETQAVVVVYTPGVGGASNVQVYCNLNRRDQVNVDYTNQYIRADGYADGIKPPDGNLITPADTGAYYTAFAMTAGGGGTYYWTGRVTRCGAYRITARYQKDAPAATNWTWYSTGSIRDHAVVVSPRKIHELTMYELNTLTIKAAGDSEGGRSTFKDLLAGDQDSFTNFNLGYLNKIQANCLWFQPIHPNAETTRGNPGACVPGSPYATRDYFAVSKWYGDATTEDDALAEFTNFVAACDAYTGTVGTINIMLDGVFNHTAWDAEFGNAGVTFGFATNKDDKIGWFKPSWYSLWTDYGEPGTYFHTVYSNDFATAPDRGDFGKWDDVTELYYGKYSALVRHNPDNNGDYLNEGDVYDFTGMGTNTMDLWKYIGYYPEYWLRQTGHCGTNSSPVDGAYAARLARDNRGLDGLRCDFGQGLPPQAWEYIINRTRSIKWNFVFMAETLDGGVPGYRSNRHFDVLNENLVFKFTQEHISNSWEFRQALEDRRTSYSGGAILLNLTGHDEVMPYNDCWMTASRYGAVSMVDGIPMIFYGQEQGIQAYAGNEGSIANTGFKKFELNFGKYIPDFKQWNQLTVWQQTPPNSVGMAQWYGRVNWARLNSAALQSPNRYFLSRTAGGDNARILAVAKYESYGASPTNSDVVLAFALILNDTHDDASDTYDLQGAWASLGMSTSKYYNARNLAASDASAYLWPSNRLGAEIYNNGIWVNLTSDKNGHTITDDGSLVQYLKVEEFDPPSEYKIVATAGANGTITPSGDVLVPAGGSTSFVVRAATFYRIAAVATNGNAISAVFNNTSTNYTFTWTSVNATGVIAATFTDQLASSNTPVAWLAGYYPGATNYDQLALSDTDNDLLAAWQERIAGTVPTNRLSMLEATVNYNAAPGVPNVVRWTGSDQAGRMYRVYWGGDLFRGVTNLAQDNITNAYPALNVYTDAVRGATATGIFYRIGVRIAN